MSILDTVENLRAKVRELGDYRQAAALAGVNYHWLQKFAGGHIKNPTIDNVAKVESFFKDVGKSS